MRIRGIVTAAATLASGLAVAAAPSSPAAPRTPCEERSWTAGVVEWCDGALVHRDHVYDDRGADTGALTDVVADWPTAGDVDHRAHGQSLNSADLLALRIDRQGDTLHVRFELNTLLPGDATIAALAIDTDDDGATGGGPWPGVDVASAGWDEVHVFDGGDPVTNTITGSITRPANGIVRLQAVVALGDGTPMNVAFRSEETGEWWDEAQAAALAAGDVSAFGARVDLRHLGTRHQPAGPPGPGLHERVFTSAFPQGEGFVPGGVAGETGAKFHFVGAHQPYALYVPDVEGRPTPQLVLHGAGEGHRNLVGNPGMQGTIGDAGGRVLVSPLGRGPGNSWVDWAARDALDALDDGVRITGADPERTIVSGYSMGGGGTMFLSTLFPDRFAAAVAWVPFTGDCLAGTPLAQGRGRPEVLGAVDSNDPAQGSGCPLETRGNSIDYLENVRHVPSGYLFGAADEVVWANHHAAAVQAFEALGYEHRIWEHAAEHLTFAFLDDWRKETSWSAGRTVVRNPARVTYRTNAYLYRPDVDLVPDGAYWVDDLRPIDASSTPAGDMVVDLTSHRCVAGHDVETASVQGAGTDPVPWVSVGRDPVGTTAPAPGDVISGTLTNVASITIDRSDACFEPGAPITLDIETDAETVINVRD